MKPPERGDPRLEADDDAPRVIGEVDLRLGAVAEQAAGADLRAHHEYPPGDVVGEGYGVAPERHEAHRVAALLDRDRGSHADIGKGSIGDEPFRALLDHPALADVPKIIETPKGDDPLAADRANLRRLRKLRRAGTARLTEARRDRGTE